MEVAASTVRRAPSPDSACSDEWTGGAICGHQEEATSDLSESSGSSSGKIAARRKSDSVLAKGSAAQDSDVDSGIVACGKPGKRIGSTSSADTDTSQETRRKIEDSPPLPKNEICKSRNSSGIPRTPKYPSTNGPIKGDHLILKECNRRPPTPLSVFPESHHCVRFDEQLQLSEQNIRRSCRKLFATLYAQRFSYPSKNENYNPLPGRIGHGSTRVRSRTAPELELRRYSPVSSVDGRYPRSFKPDSRRVATPVWNGREMTKVGGESYTENALPSASVQRQLHSTYPYIIGKEKAVRTISTDSGIGHFADGNSQCTCLSRQTSVPLSSSQSSRCCSCTQQPARSQGLFKSSSCSTLSNALSHQSRPQLTQFPPRNSKKPVGTEPTDAKLQKTPSCSSLLSRGFVSNVPVYADNMVQAYAQIASVIPEDKTPQTGRRSSRPFAKRQSSEGIYDSFKSSATQSSGKSSRTETQSLKSNSSNKDLDSLRSVYDRANGTASRMSCDSTTKSVSSDIYSQIGEVGNQSVSSVQSRHERPSSRSYSQRPKSVGVVVPSPVYLKSALKKPTQSALQTVNDSRAELQQGTINGYAAEVEYAVVDKSKKNKFASLPALNGNPSNNRDDERDHPPVPPKKFLHKSDFSIYRSRSASPRKTLLERMQTMTKNARSALQKAFSTERIYRPEKEERMEASGQKSLQRSRSFIKGITNSFRRKKRKPRTVVTETVSQQSPTGPEWEENSSGNSRVLGQLLQLNADGSQVVEVTKPSHKPYGFFVARGRVRNSKGVFVSRMRDQETQKQLAGLLDIGDEILEIDGYNVKNADIMEVNDLMAKKNTLLLTVLPFICRKDS